jgi:hypothetical protein
MSLPRTRTRKSRVIATYPYFILVAQTRSIAVLQYCSISTKPTLKPKAAMPASPYLQKNRLADVIAAIQVMGTYKFYRLDIEKWALRIRGDNPDEDHWRKVFTQHPEFFRINTGEGGASLVWRRVQPKLYHVDQRRLLSQDELQLLSQEELKRVSRKPLSADDTKTLIDTAIKLHTRSLAQKRDRRWWILSLASFAGAVIGALTAADAQFWARVKALL